MTAHIILIFLIALVAIIGIVSVKYLGPDNSVEKMAEEVIKEETGLNVDLTPSDTKVTPQSTAAVPSSPPSGSTPTVQQTAPLQSGTTTPTNSSNTP